MLYLLCFFKLKRLEPASWTWYCQFRWRFSLAISKLILNMFVCSCARRARTAGHDNSIRRYFTGIYIQYTLYSTIILCRRNSKIGIQYRGLFFISRFEISSSVFLLFWKFWDKFLKISQFDVNRSRSETALCKIDCLSLPKYFCTQDYI